MSSPNATEGAYRGTTAPERIHGPYLHNQESSESPPPGMPIRRGGLSSAAGSTVAGQLPQRHQYQDEQQQQQQQLDGDLGAAAASDAAGAAATARDRNLDSFAANTALPASFQPIRIDDNDSPPPTHPSLQIRFSHSRQGSVASHSRQGSVTGLQIRTDIPSATSTRPSSATQDQDPSQDHQHPQHPHVAASSSSLSTLDSASTIASSGLTPTTNLRKAISAASLNNALSPNGGLGSPYLSAMVDITPLPSPIMPGELSPVPWKRVRENESKIRSGARPTSAGAAQDGPSSSHQQPPPRYNMPLSPGSPPKRKKGYGSLMTTAVEAQASASSQFNIDAREHNQQQHVSQSPSLQQVQPLHSRTHARHRSISDFVPEQLQNIRPRNVTVNLSSAAPHDHQQPMHREQYLAAQRGLINPPLVLPASHPLADPTRAIPSPPPSNKSVTGSEMDEDELHSRSRPTSAHRSQTPSKLHEEVQDDPDAEYFLVRDTHNPSKKRKWRAIRPLGQGTFSKVLLATSERLAPGTAYTDANLNPSKLVAIKIVEHGPAGGADEERIEVSLKREVDILKSVRHPCIVQLKAMEYTDDRALLVLTFCPGGDLFELASERRDILTRPMVQRIFGEVIGAVRWLHEEGVVHRDLKLENVLVHPKADFLASLKHPQSHPQTLTLLTDLGLSRRIPAPPASPLLTTRCGSEDYAAPEILLGQPYDGRSTDGWALGVLLYALMEGRLPFDCPPGKIERSRVSHRVARCDWIWCRFGDEDGEWDDSIDGANEWRPAGEVVEALLKKVRMGRKSLKDVQEMTWVKDAIHVPDGLKRVDQGEEEL